MVLVIDEILQITLCGWLIVKNFIAVLSKEYLIHFLIEKCVNNLLFSRFSEKFYKWFIHGFIDGMKGASMSSLEFGVGHVDALRTLIWKITIQAQGISKRFLRRSYGLRPWDGCRQVGWDRGFRLHHLTGKGSVAGRFVPQGKGRFLWNLSCMLPPIFGGICMPARMILVEGYFSLTLSMMPWRLSLVEDNAMPLSPSFPPSSRMKISSFDSKNQSILVNPLALVSPLRPPLMTL